LVDASGLWAELVFPCQWQQALFQLNVLHAQASADVEAQGVSKGIPIFLSHATSHVPLFQKSESKLGLSILMLLTPLAEVTP